MKIPSLFEQFSENKNVIGGWRPKAKQCFLIIEVHLYSINETIRKITKFRYLHKEQRWFPYSTTNNQILDCDLIV